MKMNHKVHLAFFLYLLSSSIHCFSIKNDTLRIEVLLNKSIIKEFKESVNFISDFEVTPSKNIILSSSNQLYILGWGGFEAFGSKPWGAISSFEYSTSGLLMVIRNNELCYLDTSGKLNKLYKLPNQNMSLCKGQYAMYVFDRNSAKPVNSIYAIAYGGKYVKLLEVPKPIYSLIEVDNSLLFANDNAIMNYNLKTKEIKAIVALPNNNIIKSIAFDSKSNRLFFSTDSVIYSIKDGKYKVITNKFGGELKIIDNSLTVFDSKNQILVSITGIENHLTSNETSFKSMSSNSLSPVPITPKIEAKASLTSTITSVSTNTFTPAVTVNTIIPTPTKEEVKQVLTNDNIKKMVKSKLSDELIISVIKTSEVKFDLQVDAMIDLSNQGVSSTVILEMKNAMDKKIKKK